MNTKVTGVEDREGFFLQELESCHFSITNLTVVSQLILNQLDSNAIFQNGVILYKIKIILYFSVGIVFPELEYFGPIS